MASWVRGKCVGKGAFGAVSVGVAESDGRVFAVKSVDIRTGFPAQVEALENEIRILRRVSPSPYVVEFLGNDVTASCRNLHMEYMPGGTLADLAPRNADVDERLVRYYAWCLVNALRHVHSRGIVHCDVKGRNVLVGPNGCVAKLSDFGSAVEVSGEGCAAGVLPRGSPLWMAPEVIRRQYQGPESDVWSLGCTVIEMVKGKPAWEDHGGDTLIRIGYSSDVPEFPGQLSELGQDFLEKCLRREPTQRWSCDQLLQHPFLCPAPPNTLVYSSPRCVLNWASSDFTDEEEEEEEEEEEIKFNAESAAKERIGKLATKLRANWETEGWVSVRRLESETEYWETAVETGEGSDEGEGTSLEYPELTGVEVERNVCEYGDDKRISKNERANPEIWELGGVKWLGSPCGHREYSGESIAGWSCRYGSKNVDFEMINIYSLCCKLLNSHSFNLLSMYSNMLFSWIIIYTFFIDMCQKHDLLRGHLSCDKHKKQKHDTLQLSHKPN